MSTANSIGKTKKKKKKNHTEKLRRNIFRRSANKCVLCPPNYEENATAERVELIEKRKTAYLLNQSTNMKIGDLCWIREWPDISAKMSIKSGIFKITNISEDKFEVKNQATKKKEMVNNIVKCTKRIQPPRKCKNKAKSFVPNTIINTIPTAISSPF